MSGVWSFLRDGKPTGARFIGPKKALAANTPEGCEAVEGLVESERQIDPALERERIIGTIEALEAKQHRRIRELLMQSDPQLHAIDERIGQLRRKLSGETDTSAPEG